MDGNSCVFCFTHSEPAVRARKPNSLALPAGGHEPILSPGCFSASSSSKVRARKPNSLALPADGREPNLSPDCFSASSRSRVRARKPNLLALRAGGREPGRPCAGDKPPLLAWPDEGARACGKQGANMEGRAPGKRRLCWRGPTKAQGLAGSKAPTGKAARRGKGASVGVVRRRSKGLRGARRQHERPRAGETAPMLAWSDEEARACGEQGANRKGRAPGERRLCWRGSTKAQGLVGSKAPTGKPARRDNGAYVGVTRRWSKGLRGARRQPGSTRAGETASLLAWPDEGARLCREQGANREGRAPG